MKQSALDLSYVRVVATVEGNLATEDLIYDTRHLFTRLRTYWIKARSRGFSG